MKTANIQRIKKYKYLGITADEEGNLIEHIEELNQMCEAISREIKTTGLKNREGEYKSPIKTFCSLFYVSTDIWYRRTGIQKKGKSIQGNSLKKIFKLPVSLTYTGILMETRICPAEQRIQYATLCCTIT